MARFEIVLLVLAVLGGINGYEFGQAKRYVSSIIQKASSFVGKQEQVDTSTPYYYPEEPTTPIVCQEDGASPLPSNCGYYIRCTGGEHNVVQCEGGLHFSNETLRCEEPCRARCDPMIACYCRWETCQMSDSSTTEEPATDIPGKYHRTPDRFTCYHTGQYPKPSDCNKYISCFYGVPIVMSCPSGLHFNKETEQCELPCDAKCDLQLPCNRNALQDTWSTTATTQELTGSSTTENSNESSKKYYKLKVKFTCSEDGLFSDPSDCSKFIQCYDGQTYSHRCPAGLHFSSDTQRCEIPCVAQCDSTISCKWRSFKKSIMKQQSSEPLTCEEDGEYPVPGDCSSYLQCSSGQALLVKCPVGLHFREETKSCEEPCDARCEPTLADECGWQSSMSQKGYSATKPPLPPYIDDIYYAGTKPPLPPYIDDIYYSKPSESEDSTTCATDGHFSNPGSCSSYIRCLNGQKHVMTCPEGMHFCKEHLMCMSPCEAHCDSSLAQLCMWELEDYAPRKPEYDSACVQEGVYSSPKNCNSYVQCSSGEAYIVSCPAGLQFSEVSKTCVEPCKAQCDPAFANVCGWDKSWKNEKVTESSFVHYDMSLSTQSSSMAPRFRCTKDGKFKYPKSCSKYILCDDGHKFLLPCPPGLHFNEALGLCAFPSIARCTIDETMRDDEKPMETSTSYDMSSTTKSSSMVHGFTCTHDGTYKNPEDCSSFITCSYGQSYVMQCPSGLHFSEEVLTCVYPNEARCKIDSSTSYIDIDCEAEPEPGPCGSSVTRYYYDGESGRCKTFKYGGCEGNSNNFGSHAECYEKCQQKMLGGFRCPSHTGKYGHYPDCMRYYDCKRGIPTLKKCPHGTAFDHKKSKCVTEYKATCMYKCNDPDAVYPYVEDCHKYIDCVNGVSKVEKCPPGTAFDPESQNCVDEETVPSCSSY